MNQLKSILLIAFLFACNNEASTSNMPETPAVTTADHCGNSLWFRKGAVVHTSSYDGAGNLQARQTSTVTKVTTQGNTTVSEVEMKSTDQNNSKETNTTASFRCDGNLVYFDLSKIVQGGQGMEIETTGMPIPVKPSAGQTLPDFAYNMVMRANGRENKIKSQFKGRKVEAKETITTPAGSFECYRISAVIETEMPGLDEKSKKIMEEVQKKMGKNTMTFWYAPELTIIKMEMKTGEKLITRSEVTQITK